MDILAISLGHIGDILSSSWAHLRDILGISLGYFGNIWEIYWGLHGYILGISLDILGYVGDILGWSVHPEFIQYFLSFWQQFCCMREFSGGSANCINIIKVSMIPIIYWVTRVNLRIRHLYCCAISVWDGLDWISGWGYYFKYRAPNGAKIRKNHLLVHFNQI